MKRKSTGCNSNPITPIGCRFQFRPVGTPTKAPPRPVSFGTDEWNNVTHFIK